MKILVYGPKARYDAYMPDFAAQLGAELVFCTLDQSPRQAAAENPDAQVLFDDPIVDITKHAPDTLEAPEVPAIVTSAGSAAAPIAEPIVDATTPSYAGADEPYTPTGTIPPLPPVNGGTRV